MSAPLSSRAGSEKGMRRAGSRVSGCRTQSQIATTAASASNTRKMGRQSATTSTSWPIAGASIGTRINTMRMNDWMRAVRKRLWKGQRVDVGESVGGRLFDLIEYEF